MGALFFGKGMGDGRFGMVDGVAGGTKDSRDVHNASLPVLGLRGKWGVCLLNQHLILKTGRALCWGRRSSLFLPRHCD